MTTTTARRRALWYYFNPAGLALNLWAHHGALWQFTRRQVALRVKGSYLGALWMVFNPLLMLSLYTFVFGVVLQNRYGVTPTESAADFTLGLFLGLTLHGLIAESLGLAPSLIVNQTNLVKKVVFPLEILPLAACGAAFVNFLVSLALVLTGLFIFRGGLPASAVWLPLTAAPVLLLGAGLTWLFSALGVFLRDLGQVVGFLSLGLLYASAIFYAVDQIPEPVYAFLRFNPLLHAVDLSRHALLWGHAPAWEPLAYLWGCGVGVALLGYAVFMRLKGAFADVL